MQVSGLWGVRYQVRDVRRAVEFYTTVLGFKLDHEAPPAFGQVSIGELKLVLSGPGACRSRRRGQARVRLAPGTTR
jgi:glyoxylase I family protein